MRVGFFSAVLDSKAALRERALQTATEIAEKSPLAIFGTKRNLLYSRDHSLQDSLDYMALWSSAMLQSKDVVKAAMAVMTKTKPTFAKL